MYSSWSNPATSFVKFSDNFFQEKLSVNESSVTGAFDFRALSWDNVGFLWKSQCGVRRCATAYGMFYTCKCSLDLAIRYRKNIRSSAVTRCRIPGIFCHQIQKRRDWPLTWWLFCLSADLLDRKIGSWKVETKVIGSWKVETTLPWFLRNLLGAVPPSAKKFSEK